jgi:ribonuclease III
VLVSDRVFAELANDLGLERFLLVNASASGDRSGESSRLAEAFEALLAALYLSSKDLNLIRPWLDPQWRQRADAILADPAHQNYKAALQNWTQANYHALPEYRVSPLVAQVNEPNSLGGGSDRFRAEVWFQNKKLGEGTGTSKREAEKAAAQKAYLTLTSAAADAECSPEPAHQMPAVTGE